MNAAQALGLVDRRANTMAKDAAKATTCSMVIFTVVLCAWLLKHFN